jgi:predicted dehydrogenase
MLQAAIIGLGWWGKTLVQSVQGRSDAVRFIAGATGRRHLAETFATQNGIRLVDNLDAVLAMPEVEAVVLATPHLDHEEQVVAAAKAGKHVFVEKPFTLEKAGAERAVAATQAAGAVLAVGHNRRFHPNMVRLREAVRSGALGTILHCEGTMTSPSGLYLKPESWRVDPKQSPAGGLAGLGIHMIDGMLDIVGPMSEVCAQSTHRAVPSKTDDTTSILLRFENGATGFVSCMTATPPFYRLCIYGSAGIAEISTPSLDRFSFFPLPPTPGSTSAQPRPVERYDVAGIDTVRLELEAFAAAIEGGAPYPITTAEMVAGASVFEAVSRSARDGATWVRIS